MKENSLDRSAGEKCELFFFKNLLSGEEKNQQNSTKKHKKL